jgi:predicted TIM-barrel fold metal-dependent hydrolase
MNADQPLISADSHIAENESVYADIDPKFRDSRPRELFDERQGALLSIPNSDWNVPIGLVCTAGRKPEDFGVPARWEDIHPAGNDPKARLAIQDEEGVVAEVLYPSVGMVICNHPNIDYKKACFDAYNRWLAKFCETDPNRLLGVGMASARTVEDAVREVEEIKAMGFRSVMLPGNPDKEDWDSEYYDPLWEACADLEMPVSFHILTSKGDIGAVRGPVIITQITTIRGVQDILNMMVFGGVFVRHPKLKVVLVESDAGWVPHFKSRMDHAWARHRFWLDGQRIDRPPSEFVDEHIYVTFQDDYSVKHAVGAMNTSHILWATDFPHSDGTYPNSRSIAASVTEGLSDALKQAILYDNVAALYGLS